MKSEVAAAKPAPEIGIMVTQSLLGILTAGAVTVLPYVLLFGNGGIGDPTLASLLFVLNFSLAPVAVAGVQTLLGAGSQYYRPSAWLPILVGLAAEAIVLSFFYATGWLPTGQASGGVPNGGSVAFLMVGSIGVVPLLQMVAINLFKQPRPRALVALDDAANGVGVVLSAPSLSPVLTASPSGMVWGVQFSPLRGRF